jgi:putative transposase
MKKRHSEEQIARALRLAESWVPAGEICRDLGVSEPTFYRWKKRYGGLGVSELRELRQLREENGKLKRLVADLTLDKHILLRREGWEINHKRTYRLYREEGLALKRKGPKRHRSATERVARPAASEPNERWCMDFVSDTLADGRRIRVLTVLDTCTRECVALEVAGSLRGQDVAAVLTRVGLERGVPAAITCDHGPEFTSRALDHWAYQNRVRLDFTRPGKPTDNAHIESFNGRLRQECLSQHWFLGLADARRTIELWREDYNNHRPHSALENRIPLQYRRGGYYVPDRDRLQKLRA